jgi:hypothetical protein
MRTSLPSLSPLNPVPSLPSTRRFLPKRAQPLPARDELRNLCKYLIFPFFSFPQLRRFCLRNLRAGLTGLGFPKNSCKSLLCLAPSLSTVNAAIRTIIRTLARTINDPIKSLQLINNQPPRCKNRKGALPEFMHNSHNGIGQAIIHATSWVNALGRLGEMISRSITPRLAPSSLAKDAAVRQPLNMAEVLEHSGPPPFVVHPTEAMAMNDDEFFEFCHANADLRIERNAGGDIIITVPEGGSSGSGSSEFNSTSISQARRPPAHLSKLISV